MRPSAILALFTLAFATGPALAGDAALREGDVVAVCGDSITEQKDYSVDIEDYLLMCRPAAGLQAVQFGWGGETSWGFLGRIGNDVLRFAPTVATTCYGMNDGGYAPLTEAKAKQYREAHKGIVAAFKKAGVRFIVVGSPGCVDSQTFRRDPQAASMYNKTLGQLRDIAKQVAEEEGVAFADVFEAMSTAMVKAKARHGVDHPFGGGDGVHPGRNGHLAMAYAFLKALGCDGAIGTISVDLAAGSAKASDGHRIDACAGGVVTVTSSRYPFCFSGDPAGQTTRSAVEFVPFNQELNRFLLVVSNPGGERVKVTWGAASKEFTAAELAAGVNLAAEFLDNPFSPAFAKVEATIRAQQHYETPLVKSFLHSLPQYQAMLPEEQATWESLAGKAIAKDRELRAAAAAAVVPVTHRIELSVVKP
jgi:lysophospholipase L1-like esterase